MRVDRVRRAPHDVNATAIGLPSRLAGRVVVVGILNAPIMLFAKLVLKRIGIWVAPLPETLNERLALLVIAQAQKRSALIVGDDVVNFLVQPGFIRTL